MTNRSEGDRRYVFVSGAFTCAASGAGPFDSETRARICNVIQGVRDHGGEVYSAHLREDWGQRLDMPTQLAASDMEGLRNMSHLVAYVGHVPSVGTYIEIGVAIALARPVLVFVERGVVVRSDYMLGLVELGLVNLIEWQGATACAEAMGSFLGYAGQSGGVG